MNRLRSMVLAVGMLAALVPLGIANVQARADGERQVTGLRESPRRLTPIFPIDIRVVIACRDESERQTAQQLARQLAPVVDAIAAGAKLTKADAARMGLPEGNPDEIDDFRDWFLSTLTRYPGRGIYVFSVSHSTTAQPQTSAKQIAGGCPPGCVPPGVCDFCFRLLDYDGPKLSTFDVDDTDLQFTLGSLGGSSGGSAGSSSGGAGGGSGGGAGGGASGGAGGGSGGGGASGGSSGGPGGGRLAFDPQRPIVVIVLERPGATRAQIEELVRKTLEAQRYQSITPRLVIKTPSSPR